MNTNTFVYICRGGANEELRYSIRSVMHYFPDAEIIIVGSPPDWYNGKTLYVPQNKDKYFNASKNLHTICHSEEIPEEFVFMNDDFFIVEKIRNIPLYHGGSFLKKVEKYKTIAPRGSYTRRLVDTFKTLRRLGISDPLDYDLHVPMVVEKSKLKRAIQFDVLWRSVYGNVYNSGGIEISDVKVYLNLDINTHSYDFKNGRLPFISTEDKVFPFVRDEIFEKKFGKPSKYESPNKWGEGKRCPNCGHLV